MADESAELKISERMVLRKFDGDVPPDCDDPAAAGFRLTEEITIEDGQIIERKVYN